MRDNKVSETNRAWHNSALQNQREIGLWILRNLVLLNGSGIVLILTHLSSSDETSFAISIQSLRHATIAFISGISLAFLLAVIGYATALYSNPNSGKAEIPYFKRQYVEKTYFLCGIGSFMAFITAVMTIVFGVIPQ